jgi:hypothetical protein
MRSVLGIDAAWTEKHASGVALAVEDANGWRLKGAWPSVAHFLADAYGQPFLEEPSGGVGPANDLLAAARGLAGSLPDLVAIDILIALEPITGKRRVRRRPFAVLSDAAQPAVECGYNDGGSLHQLGRIVRPG